MGNTQNLFSKSRIIGLSILAMMLLLISSCEDAGVTNPTLQAASDDCVSSPWAITFQKSGGIAGQTETLSLSDTGKLTAINQQQQVEVNTSISANELALLEGLMGQMCAYTDRTSPSGCADCFVYSLKIQMSGRIYFAQLDELTLHGSELEPLFAELIQLLSQTLEAQP